MHQVNKSWSEYQVTRKFRAGTLEWNELYLALDGTDAFPTVQDTVTMCTDRPASYVEFNVTHAGNEKLGM